MKSNVKMATEIADKASFEKIRYAQCWEDADVLLEALDIQEGDTCLGIGSGGENCLSMLTRNPSKVIAVDMNPSQLACIELKVAAFKCLEHGELLELIGSKGSGRREQLFRRCAAELSDEALTFWKNHPGEIAAGIGGAGKFERYFSLFRRKVIPLIHNKKRVQQLLEVDDLDRAREFYDSRWNNLRWRICFKIFFSRWMMGRLGRDPAFFDYVTGSVADRILERTRHALCELKPAENPYLQWILTGEHPRALPHALRPENFELIRRNIDRLELRLGTVEEVLDDKRTGAVDRFNLSDIFEYMSNTSTQQLLKRIVDATSKNGRIAYWNMLAPRSCPAEWQGRRIDYLAELGDSLLAKDKAFFYSAFIVEQKL